MYLVDTNVFLEVLLLQDKKEECEKLLEQLRKGKKLESPISPFTP
jgi:predicted nucleic acid-binding protein